MSKKNMNQQFRLTKIDEIRNYLIKEINRNGLMSKDRVLDYIDIISHIAISPITGCVSISAFASLVGIPIGIASSTIGLKICVITIGIKKYKLIIKKKRKKHDKIVLSLNSKLNSIEVLISQALIDLSISHNEFVLINNVLQDFYHMKEEIKSSNK